MSEESKMQLFSRKLELLSVWILLFMSTRERERWRLGWVRMGFGESSSRWSGRCQRTGGAKEGWVVTWSRDTWGSHAPGAYRDISWVLLDKKKNYILFGVALGKLVGALRTSVSTFWFSGFGLSNPNPTRSPPTPRQRLPCQRYFLTGSF